MHSWAQASRWRLRRTKATPSATRTSAGSCAASTIPGATYASEACCWLLAGRGAAESSRQQRRPLREHGRKEIACGALRKGGGGGLGPSISTARGLSGRTRLSVCQALPARVNIDARTIRAAACHTAAVSYCLRCASRGSAHRHSVHVQLRSAGAGACPARRSREGEVLLFPPHGQACCCSACCAAAALLLRCCCAAAAALLLLRCCCCAAAAALLLLRWPRRGGAPSLARGAARGAAALARGDFVVEAAPSLGSAGSSTAGAWGRSRAADGVPGGAQRRGRAAGRATSARGAGRRGCRGAERSYGQAAGG